MKNIILILVLIIILSSVIFSQTPKLIGPIGGGVVDIAIHKFFPSVIYSSNSSGACFRSIDGGESVKPIRMVGDLYYYLYPAPTDTSLCFAMTLEEVLLRSKNSGLEFEKIEIDEEDHNRYLQFNPLNSKEIFLIRKENEIWKSFNCGDTWQKIYTFDTTLTTRVAIAPNETSFVYVVAADRIYRSTDSGISWEFRGQIPEFLGRIVQLKVNPQNKNSIYLWGGGWPDSFGKFYKSSNGGKTFIIVQSDLFLNDFEINPIDTNVIYYASPSGLYKSLDEGINYFAIHNGLPTDSIGCSTIELNPQNPEELYAGINNDGVYKSIDAGNFWYQCNLSYSDVIRFEFISNEPGHLIATQYDWFAQLTTSDGDKWFEPNYNPPHSNFYGISFFDINPFNKEWGYLTDYTKTYKTSDAGLNWQQITLFDSSIAVWYHKFNINILFGGDVLGNIWRTTDSGSNWEIISTDFGGGWFVFDPHNDSIIYAYGTLIDLQKSTDMGVTWQDKTNGLLPFEPGSNNPAPVRGVAVRKDNPMILYCVQGFNGGISKSINGGENWFQIDSSFRTLNTSMYFTEIYLDDNKPGRFYVSTLGNGSFTDENAWGGLFLTEDDGLSWRKIYTGSADLIKGDDSDPKNIYFGSIFGILKIPDTLTTSISEMQTVIPTDFVLYQNYPNPFNPSTIISFSIPEKSFVTLKVYDVLGREIATLINEQKPAGEYLHEFHLGELSSGVYFYTLKVGKFTDTKKMILLR